MRSHAPLLRPLRRKKAPPMKNVSPILASNAARENCKCHGEIAKRKEVSKGSFVLLGKSS